ncbi:helical backbone metal receptor [bacterium]|nr:helical backbone metal receptor [bacterium]
MKRKIIFLISLGVIILLFFLLPNSKKDNTIVPKNESKLRIISLGPYVTENLFLLGMDKNIIGLTIHDLPERKKRKEIIGTLIAPNIEKILTLKPDIVIGAKEGNKPETIYELQKLGIRTLTLKELYSFDDINNNFLALGEILNVKKIAENIISRNLTELNQILDKPEEEKKKKVFFILGFNPLITTGRNTYINEMISFAGGENIFKDIEKKWFTCSFEEVVRRNPDVILFIGMDKDTNFFDNRLSEIGGIKESSCYEMEDTVIGSPTPETFVNSVKKLNELFYKLP